MNELKTEKFGVTSNGEEAHLFTIRMGQMKAVLTDYGASLQSLMVPGADGALRDVVLGYDTLEEYEKGSDLFGAVVGRVANRVSGASFELNKRTYYLDQNEGKNCNHSGFRGYHLRMWKKKESMEENDGSSVTFFLDSPDGDQGFSGNLRLAVTYSLRDDNALAIRYRAVSDCDTALNVTNHSYFNLKGQGEGDILDHRMQIYSMFYTPIGGADQIPDGSIQSVLSTPFDFSCPKNLGQDIRYENVQLRYGNGYNHNYVITANKGEMKTVAKVFSRQSGIGMEVRTDLPGVQLYTGNELARQRGKNGAWYEARSGFALETQYYPNSLNTPGFIPCILRENTPWDSKTVFRFYQV